LKRILHTSIDLLPFSAPKNVSTNNNILSLYVDLT
jgi:hypothetical protein